ncbi:MAG: hypothetical protein HY040_10160 [Planctomycetes bacterium]|nr:hypothetical protein [Planctomycetota bacterium]
MARFGKKLPPAHFFSKIAWLNQHKKMGHDCMVENHLESLKNDERRWEVALKLFDFTRNYLRVRRGWQEDMMLPGGQDPEGIVYGLIEKVLAGDRPLNDGEDLMFQLKGMIRSEVSNLFASSDAKGVSFKPAGDEGPSHEPVDGAAADEIVGSMDFCRRLFELLEQHPRVQADEDFGLVVLAYEEGADSSMAVAEKAGIKIERVYEYNRQLKTMYPAIKAKLD